MSSVVDEVTVNRAIAISIRITFVGLLLIMAYLILEPFIMPILWGIIIAVGFYPAYSKLARLLGNRQKLAAVTITVFTLSVLIIPSVLLMDSTIESLQLLATQIEEGSITVPPPAKDISGWPVIGKPIYDFWSLASVNLEDALITLEPQLREYAPTILSAIADIGATILLSIISIIIAGALMLKADASERMTNRLLTTLLGGDGKEFTRIASATIRSVAQGVLGVAIIQFVLSGIGMMVVQVPAAGVWALLILIAAIIQLPLILILGPLVVYVFSIADTTTALIFMIYCILVSVSDTFLKPIFLGRGTDIPTLVILLGAIGGLLLSGIIGLFVGSVMLALGYKVFQLMMLDESGAKNS